MDNKGKQLILDATNETLYLVNNGTPESTNIDVTNVDPDDTTTETTGTTEITENPENP